MSYEVDNRVVSMEFDNEEFEKRVKQSQSSLDKLKNSLNFEESSKSVNNLQNEINKFDVSGITKGIDTLENRFSVFGTFAGRIVENFADGVYSKVKNIITAIPNQIKTGGWSRTKNTEGAKFLLEGILEGDPQENKKTIQSIIDGQVALAVNDTAFGADEASKIAANLIASDVNYDTSKVNKDWLETFASSGQAVSEVKDQLDDLSLSLMAISGVASMTNSGYQEIGDIFTKVKAAGKAQMMQISQLTQRGLPAIQALADYMQVTAEDISEYSRKGLIDYDTFVNAMFDAYADQAKRADDTFEGSMANMKSALSRIGQKFLTPVYNNMTRVFKSLKGLINRVNAQLTPIADKFGTIFEALTIKVSDFINKSLDASLITSAVRILVRAFDLLLSVVTPIGQALGEVFGGNGFLVDLKQANVAISQWLKNITLTAKEQEKFKNVLVGLFKIIKAVFTVIINVGKSAFNILRGFFNIIYGLFTFIKPILSGVSGIFKDFFKGLSDLLKIKLDGSGLVNFTKSFVELTQNFRASEKYQKTVAKFFNNLREALKKLGDVLKPIAQMIGIVFGGIAYLVKGLIDLLPPFEWFTDLLKGGFEYLKAYAIVLKEKFAPALNDIKDFFGPITETLNTWKDELKKATEDIADSIIKGESLQEVFEKIRNTKITPPDLEKLSAKLDKVTNKLKKAWDRIKEVVSGVFNALKGFFTTQFNQLKDMTFAEHLANVFLAIFGIVQTLNMAGGTGGGISAFVNFMNLLSGTFKSADKIGKGITGIVRNLKYAVGEIGQLIKVKVIQAYVTAILELVAALVILSFIPTEKLTASIIALALLMWGIQSFVKGINTYGKALSQANTSVFNKTALAFAASIFLLSEALSVLSKIDFDKFGDFAKAFGLLVAVAGAIMIFVLAWEKLHKVFFASGNNGGKGGVTGVLNNYFTGISVKGVRIWGLNVLAFAAGIKILLGVFKELGAVKDWNQYLVPVAIMAAMFGALIAIGRNTNKDMLAMGAGIFLIAMAFKKFGKVLMDMANTFDDIEHLGKVLTLMVVGIGAFVVAIAALMFAVDIFPESAKKIRQLAVAVFVLSLALGALVLLSTTGKLWTAIGALTAVLAIVMVFGAIAGGIPVIAAGLAALGTAMLGIGTGVLAAAAGFALFVVAVSLLAGSLSALAAAIILAGPLIKKALFVLIDIFIEGLDYLLTVLEEHINSIVEKIIVIVIKAFGAAIKGFVIGIQWLLIEAIESLPIPGLANSKLMKGWKQSLEDNLSSATKEAAEKGTSDGLSKGLDAVSSASYAGTGSGGGLFSKLKAKITGPLGSLFGSGDSEGLAGVNSMITNLSGSINTGVAGMDLSGAQSALDTSALNLTSGSFDLSSNDSLSSIFTTFGTEGVDAVAGGMEENTESLEDAADSNVTTYVDQANSSKNQNKAKKSGENTVLGQVKGLLSEAARKELLAAADKNADTYYNEYNKRMDQHSPSRRMEKAARFTVGGLIKGFEEMQRPLENTAYDVADSAYQSMAYGISAIDAAVNSDIIATPTVYPVMDMSDVYWGMNQIDSAFSSGLMSLNTSADLATSIETSGVLGFSQQLNKSNQSLNAETVQAIKGVQNDVSRLEEAILNMGFYINDGALVGQIVGGIDRQLGVRQGYKGRNM